MAVFKYYNFQLLPVDTEAHAEVGIEGYKRVLIELRKKVTGAKRQRAIETIAGRLRNDFHFAPFVVTVLDEFAYGEFLKFDKVEKVQNLYTGQDEFEGNQGSTSKRYDYLFAFDYSTHTLAIQIAKGLPSAQPLIDALIDVFRPIVDEVHPNHQLHIQELTSAESLAAVFAAERYKRVEIEVTFSNSQELEEELFRNAGATEKDLKSNSVHSVTHIEKPAKKGTMSGLSMLAKPLLVIATQYGNANVNYKTAEGEWDHYHMRDYPVKEELVPAKEETHQNFMARVFHSIRSAWHKTAVAESVDRELQELGSQSEDASRNDSENGGELV
ncbi:DUF4747 family protein [Marinobacter adhaerens]|uniref:DUF4747 family protein n=1 Tax=Marinobacter adhaerens TaxID=1033846 RepID=UPI003D2E045F